VVQPRIVGGTLVPPGLYPYFVQGDLGCGGTLVAKDVVLSAAHCAWAFDKWVIVGSTESMVATDGAQNRSILSELHKHPNFDAGTHEYDYLLFKIEPVTEPGLVPASLNEDPANPATDQVVTAVGFGSTAEGVPSHYLRHVDVKAVSPNACHQQIAVQVSDVAVNDAVMVCAGNRRGRS
jgi:secreted trypsin-like serine protease